MPGHGDVDPEALHHHMQNVVEPCRIQKNIIECGGSLPRSSGDASALEMICSSSSLAGWCHVPTDFVEHHVIHITIFHYVCCYVLYYIGSPALVDVILDQCPNLHYFFVDDLSGEQMRKLPMKAPNLQYFRLRNHITDYYSENSRTIAPTIDDLLSGKFAKFTSIMRP
uniref:Uncharacterized protein n=1 Tax=Romanomermis culicivorax TaxID=13658 RepID=A0A915IFJ8_ROMCU